MQRLKVGLEELGAVFEAPPFVCLLLSSPALSLTARPPVARAVHTTFPTPLFSRVHEFPLLGLAHSAQIWQVLERGGCVTVAVGNSPAAPAPLRRPGLQGAGR